LDGAPLGNESYRAVFSCILAFMISRKSTKLIADAYAAHFTSPLQQIGAWGLGPKVYKLKDDEAYNFLYEQEHETWFLQVMARHITGQTTQTLTKAIMGIHTGETIVPAATDWTFEARQKHGQILLKKLAEDMLRLYEVTPRREIDYSKIETDKDLDFWQKIIAFERPAESTLVQLKTSLELDGYLLLSSRLYPTEGAVIDTLDERTALETLVDSIPINEQVVIKHHIQESEKAYGESRWGHSISDARNFLEAILREIASAHHVKTKGIQIADSIYKWPVKVREYLLTESLIDKSEQEALSKIYGLLSNTGSHPNIPEKDQARLMRHLSLTFSQYMLLQWQGYLKNNP
jgi:hypothetical protein